MKPNQFDELAKAMARSPMKRSGIGALLSHARQPQKQFLSSLVGLAIFSVCAIATHGHAAIVDYGVYKVEARINGDDLHPGMTKIDSKAPGLGSTGASASVSDSYGAVSSAWSINPLTAHEAQVNMDMAYQVSGSSYANSYAGENGEIHFNYHSDTPFTVEYYWDLTWDLYPHGFLDFNFFAQSVRLRIYDSMDNWVDYWGPTTGSQYYGFFGRYTGSTSIPLGAGDWLFIVFDGGSAARYGGERESLSGNVYLDFDGGSRVLPGYPGWAASNAGGQTADLDYNHDGISNGVAYFMGMNGRATNPGVINGKVTWPHVNAVTSFMVQVSDNLADWTPAAAGDIDTTSNPGFVIYTLPSGAAKKFCRLAVTP